MKNRNLPKIFLNQGETPMTKSFDGLIQLIKKDLRREIKVGEIFIFPNKRRDKIKAIRRLEDGFFIFYRRLDEGTFVIEKRKGYKQISYVDPQKLIESLRLDEK